MKKILLNLDSFIAVCSLIVIVCITLAGVITRYIIGQPFAWLEEIQLLCFVYTIFFGGSVAFRTGTQISIDLIANRLSAKSRKILYIFDYLFTMAILGYLLYGGIGLMKAVSGKVTPYFKINYMWIDLAAPVGIALMILQYTISIYMMIKTPADKPKEGGKV